MWPAGFFAVPCRGQRQPSSPTCTPLQDDHVCRRVSTSNYSFTQYIPGVDVLIESPGLSVGLVLYDALNPPPQCADSLLYLACLLIDLPCDPESGLPYPICERSCASYELQTAEGTCHLLNEEFFAIAQSTVFNLDYFGSIADIHENFDCRNTSTYVFIETEFDEDNCTDILSPSAIAEIEASIGCVPQPEGVCIEAGYSPMEHYIASFGDREQDAVVLLNSSVDDVEIDAVCSSLLLALACRYTYPPCNPISQTQYGLCPETCSMVEDVVMERCASYLTQVKGLEKSFARFVAGFSCANATYLVAGVPVDTECDTLDGINFMTSTSTSTGAIVGACVAALAVVLLTVSIVIVSVCYCKSRRKKRARIPSYSLSTVVQGDNANANLYKKARRGSFEEQTSTEEPTVTLTTADKKQYEVMFASVLVPYARLTFGDTLGRGAFGKVLQGKLQSLGQDTQVVAVKTVKHLTSQQQLKEFFSESLIMKDFEHPNVLGLMGVCLDTPDGFPCIILPYMAQGNLRSYLKGKRVHVTDVDTLPKELPVELLIHMCVDVANGMRYLAKRMFVHRDLAARNCMVDFDLAIRVGDFGLARDIYTANYYRADKNARLPVKWMPPETLHDGISNEKTDMWSFGVTCWEVFSLGRSPYPGVDNAEIVQHIANGGRLGKPTLCPPRMFQIIQKCWELKPEDRPSFKEMVETLQEYWDEEHFYIVRSLSAV